MKFSDVTDWKAAIRERLDAEGTSRYAFIRRCADAGIVTVHSGECLLADVGTVTGQRIPSLHVALDMANLAGLDVRFVRRRESRRKRRKESR